MYYIKGKSLNDGIGFGKIFIISKVILNIYKKNIKNNYILEIKKLYNSFKNVRKKLEKIFYNNKNFKKNKILQDLLNFYITILNDKKLILKIKNDIIINKLNVEFSVKKIFNNYIKEIENINNKYINERKNDINEIKNYIIFDLLNIKYLSNINFNYKKNIILLIDNLSVNDISKYYNKNVKAFITNKNISNTSHVFIMIKSLKIPLIFNDILFKKKIIKNNDLLYFNSINKNCDLFINPNKKIINKINLKIKNYEKKNENLYKLRKKPNISLDNKKIKLSINICNANELENNIMVENNIDSIGLYRTEFLYINSNNIPTEDEQYLNYKKILQNSNKKFVTIRTIDIGFDKKLSYLKIEKDYFSALGCRGIRFCLSNIGLNIFKIQIRALLRASVYGKLKILFPMISILEEFQKVMRIIENEKKKLLKEKILFSNNIKFGIMIETPAVSILIDKFVEKVDFFSIGTNDLIQYFMAANRLNKKVEYLYKLHPSIIRIMYDIIKIVNLKNKDICICGEIASDLKIIPLLLGLGINEISVHFNEILKIRNLIRKININKIRLKVKKNIKNWSTINDIKKFLIQINNIN